MTLSFFENKEDVEQIYSWFTSDEFGCWVYWASYTIFSILCSFQAEEILPMFSVGLGGILLGCWGSAALFSVSRGLNFAQGLSGVGGHPLWLISAFLKSALGSLVWVHSPCINFSLDEPSECHSIFLLWPCLPPLWGCWTISPNISEYFTEHRVEWQTIPAWEGQAPHPGVYLEVEIALSHSREPEERAVRAPSTSQPPGPGITLAAP